MNDDIQDVDLLNNEPADVTNNEVDVDKLKETNAKLYARAKQAEQERKELQAKLKELENKATINQPNSVSKEEFELGLLKVAKGYDDETVAHLQTIAKGTGSSLQQAMDNPLFKVYLEKKEIETRESKAQLGASRGAGVSQPQSMANMSREDHQKLVKEKLGFN